METKQDLQEQLRVAESELQAWERQRLTREDGSPAQDQRFENRGDHLRERIAELSGQLRALA